MGTVAITCDRCCKQLTPDDIKLVTVVYAQYGTIGAILCPDCCTEIHVFFADFCPQKFRLPSLIDANPSLRERLRRRN